VKSFIVRQLQVCGGKEVAAALGKLLADRDLCEPATQALLAIEQGAAGQFRSALAKAEGAQRLTVVQALGVLRDGKSAGQLHKLVKDEDRDTRLTALWALGNMGDAGSVDVLLKAADVKTPHERIKATQACLLLAERLRAAGRDSEARKVYKHLKETRTGEAEKYVRDAAERALASK
jgi:HEAT repeat protein